MALRWIEGFETNQHFNYAQRRYATYSGTSYTSAGAAGRRHGSARADDFSEFVTLPLVGSVQNTWIMQMAIRKDAISAFSGDTGPTMVFSTAGGDQLTIKFVTVAAPDVGPMQIEVRRGATVLATSNRLFENSSTTHGWWVFQVKATIATGTGGSVEIRWWDYQNNTGTTVNITGVNTANTGAAGADRFKFSSGLNSNSVCAIDDIVIMDSTGTANNDFTSVPLIVYGELPNADGATLDWVPSTGTAHFSLVDDAAVSPTGTDEVTSDVVGDIDLYDFAQAELNLIPTTGTVPVPIGIMVDVEGLMKNSGTHTLRIEVLDGVNQATDGTDLVFNDTLKVSKFAILEQNPTGTPAPWSVAALKTIKMGPNNFA